MEDPRDDDDEKPREKEVSPFYRRDNSRLLSLGDLSLEILVKIMSSLSLKEILRLETTGSKLSLAATIHLRTRKSVDFTEGKWYGEMSPLITDGIFSRLLQRCPEVNFVLGIHPTSLTKRRQRHTDVLSVDGITAALTYCKKLKSIGTSNIQVLDAMLAIKPNLEIAGGFRNRGGDFPIPPNSFLSIPTRVKLSQLVLTGVTVPSLPTIEGLTILQLRWVKFTDHEPFKDFSCPKLEHFIMKNCMGVIETGSFSPRVCIPLFHALGRAAHLERLELVRVPFPGGVFRHVVEENWRLGSFRYLTRVSLASCYDAIEVDLGYLVLVSAFRLEELCIQPSLTKDAVFSALLMAHAEYPRFESLHLGYADDFPEKGKYTEEELQQHGLMIEREQTPALSDRGLKLALQVFPQLPAIQFLKVQNMFKRESTCELTGPDCANSNDDGHLLLSSQVIKSVFLQKCGIIKLSVEDCPKLSSISCTSCKELSEVKLRNCLLNRAKFTLCPALEMKTLLDELYNLPVNAGRIISLNPTESFDPAELERQVFESMVDYPFCVIKDEGNHGFCLQLG
ncbi:F-box only protein 38 [Stylophora pistillata]|uniref:F-box only protein 38 n=1 Tax=Stylophora pistillata TaxID=50429 RepID=A0A2B4R3X7_STYPI|nr:F-box only protein 38 [Stylophora pistillata]PFX14196.1 F-box only protein 38 [Stylophora pistillata]